MEIGCSLKEMITLIVSKFSFVSWRNRQKRIMVCSSFEKII